MVSLNLSRNCQTVFHLQPLPFPPAMPEGSDFCALLLPDLFLFVFFMPAILVVFHAGHPCGCQVISRCGWICISLQANEVEHLFLGLLARITTSCFSLLSPAFQRTQLATGQMESTLGGASRRGRCLSLPRFLSVSLSVVTPFFLPTVSGTHW